MKATITVEFTAKNLCNKQDLTGKLNTFEKMVRYLIKLEGLFGIVEDKYKILNIKEKIR